MIEINCDICAKEMSKKGAVLWSPPKLRFLGEKETCEKYNICLECYSLLIKWIKNGK